MTNKKTGPTPLTFPLSRSPDTWADAYRYVLAACRAAGIEVPVDARQRPILWKVECSTVPREQFDRFIQALIDQVEILGAMRAEPLPGQFIVKRTLGLDDLVVSAETILVPRSGQLVGIIGHAVLPHGDIVGGAVSEDAIRVVAADEATVGYLFACLSSEYGRRQLKARAFGSSIPHLDVRMVRSTIVPRLDDGMVKAVGRRAFRVAVARTDAVGKEREARALVERWIEQKGAA